MIKPNFSILFIALTTAIGLAACNSGTTNSSPAPTNNTAILSILPSSAMSESVQYCLNNSTTDTPMFVNNISNNGIIVGGTYSPVTSIDFPDIKCSYNSFTTNGTSFNIESTNQSVIVSNNNFQAYSSQILSISDNNLLVGELQFNPSSYVAAISSNNQLSQIQPTTVPDEDSGAETATAINSSGTLLVGSYGGTLVRKSYLYNVGSSQYFTPALNVENVFSSQLTSVSNSNIAVGGLKDTNGNILGLICSVESCITYTQDINEDSSLVSISENSKYIIGQRATYDGAVPFYLFRNNGHNSVLNLEPDFIPLKHSLTNDGVSILTYVLSDDVEEAYYFYNPNTHSYYNLVDFINSLGLNIEANDNDAFRVSGISNNGKYLYGHITQASSYPELAPVIVPWKIYFPNGITNALASFQQTNVSTLRKNLKTKNRVKTTSKFMN